MSEITRSALITGGARGIGRGLALSLLRDGWSVAVCYRNSTGDAESLLELSEQLPGRALAVRADAAEPAACRELVERTLAEHGRIDALVHGVGPYHRAPLLDETDDRWRATFDSNLHAVFTITRLVAPVMQRQQFGRVVTFSMAQAERAIGQTEITAHYVAKVALLALTRSFAKALAGDGVTVNALSPGGSTRGALRARSCYRRWRRFLRAGWAQSRTWLRRRGFC